MQGSFLLENSKSGSFHKNLFTLLLLNQDILTNLGAVATDPFGWLKHVKFYKLQCKLVERHHVDIFQCVCLTFQIPEIPMPTREK